MWCGLCTRGVGSFVAADGRYGARHIENALAGSLWLADVWEVSLEATGPHLALLTAGLLRSLHRHRHGLEGGPFPRRRQPTADGIAAGGAVHGPRQKGPARALHLPVVPAAHAGSHRAH